MAIIRVKGNICIYLVYQTDSVLSSQKLLWYNVFALKFQQLSAATVMLHAFAASNPISDFSKNFTQGYKKLVQSTCL